MVVTPTLVATLPAASRAHASAVADGRGARRSWPWSGVKPASVQPMVPLRSATTWLGRPALISDCAPMMLRVRPAQLTTTSVAGSGAASRMRNTSSAPGMSIPPGIDTR
jgi:hypothetical protein